MARAFESYPRPMRRKLLALRALILRTAAATEGVGELEETLKWGEPAYVTAQSKSGSTVRIGWKASRPSEYAMYFHCRTDLVGTFKAWFPRRLRFEGNRAIIFNQADAIPADLVASCIAEALTYRRKGSRRDRP